MSDSPQAKTLVEMECEAVQQSARDLWQFMVEKKMDTKVPGEWAEDQVLALIWRSYKTVNDKLGFMLGQMKEPPF